VLDGLPGNQVVREEELALEALEELGPDPSVPGRNEQTYWEDGFCSSGEVLSFPEP
jgi:hypothetical protein